MREMQLIWLQWLSILRINFDKFGIIEKIVNSDCNHQNCNNISNYADFHRTYFSPSLDRTISSIQMVPVPLITRFNVTLSGR